MLDLVVSDVCGKLPVHSMGGSNDFVTFIDDYSRFSIVYCIQNKSEVFSKLKEYIEHVKVMFGKNNGGEYMKTEVQDYLKREGIV